MGRLFQATSVQDVGATAIKTADVKCLHGVYALAKGEDSQQIILLIIT